MRWAIYGRPYGEALAYIVFKDGRTYKTKSGARRALDRLDFIKDPLFIKEVTEEEAKDLKIAMLEVEIRCLKVALAAHKAGDIND